MGHTPSTAANEIRTEQNTETYKYSIKKAAKYRTLLSGYFREIQYKMNLTIPHDIQDMITNDYCTQFIVFGAGSNKHGLFGLGHIQSLQQFTNLLSVQQLAPHPMNIYHNSNGIIIQDINNKIYAAGFNRYSALGINSSSKNIQLFTKIDINDKILIPELISRGSHNTEHTFIYGHNSKKHEKHKLIASGYNYGQFGNRRYNQHQILLEIDISFILDKIIDIKCGMQHTLFLTQHGMVFGFGQNGYGQCGVSISNKMKYNNYKCNISKPTKLEFPFKILKLNVGTFYSLLINDKHQLICFGANHFGQCGVNNLINNNCMYQPVINQFFNENNIKIMDIECNETHSLCLDINGNCYSFGRNDCGQIGNGTVGNHAVFKPYKIEINCSMNKKKMIDFSCGKCHNILLSDDHRIIVFGDNEYKQCSSMYDEEVIPFPYILSKFNELGGINELSFVEKVFAFNQNTIIIINPWKTVKY